ncbi:MAG: hypothetical protein JXM70_00980 [Pirellulales bacterium]|nr:hypothetical protein [Pirellulales bacterium]
MHIDNDKTVIPSKPTLGEQNIAALIAWNQRRLQAQNFESEARPIRSLGIVGAGVMGTSIAASAISSDLPVGITDVSQEALDSVRSRITLELKGNTGFLPLTDPHWADRLLRITADLDEVVKCDLVLEAVKEDLLLKQQLLRELERKMRGDSVLASNTSTISIDHLASNLVDPSRICGIHFFLPVCRQRLIEIVSAPRCSRTTLATAVSFARLLGKIALVVPDGPAFLVNRLLMSYLSEALQLVTEGVPIEQVDQVATEFGMVRGPLSLIDQIGLDIVLACAFQLHDPIKGRMISAPLLVTMIKAGRLGIKRGAGFYRYLATNDWNASGIPDPALAPILAQWIPTVRPFSVERIRSRLFFPMVLEATRILAEGRLDDPRDIDLAVVFGFGFPAARGGLLYWADTLGAAQIIEQLKLLKSLGDRAEPTRYLLDMAASGHPFYSGCPEPIMRQNEAAP